MDRIITLFEKYQNNQCSPQEIEELLEYFRIGQDETLLKAHIDIALSNDVAEDQEVESATNEVYRRIRSEILRDKPITGKIIPLRWIAAASILLLIGIASYFLRNKNTSPQIAQNQDVSFGTNHAILKLGHSKIIVLDNIRNGLIAQKGNTTINKTANGQINYATGSAQTTGQTAPIFDTLINPAGAKIYHLNLSDGSKLVVNAATTIRFPETFAKNERKVDLLTGEVFFEVTHKESQPFNVYTKGQIIKDLGTQFNVSAYQDEPLTKVTLLVGSLSVSKGKQSVTLKPGQQTITENTNTIQLIKNADTDEAIAWKEGIFNFNSEDLAGIMRKVSRWYDVSVIYTDDSVKDIPFGAITTRFANVSQVLKMLERTKQVHFKIEGKKIIVSK